MIKSASRSSLVEDVKYTSMSAGVVPSNEYLISSTLLTQNEPSVTFDVSSFAGVYKHLQVVLAGRSDESVYFSGLRVRLGSGSIDSGTNYSTHQLYGYNGSVASGGEINTTWMFSGAVFGASAPANFFGGTVIDILDPFSTSKNTTIRAFSGSAGGTGANAVVSLESGVWRNTSSVGLVQILRTGSNFVSGTRISIYGVTA